jgi:hypothetical protein
MAEMPRIDGDGFRLAAPLAVSHIYAVPVSACTGWNEVCVRSVVSKATEIATAKVYEVMHVNMQQRPMAKMPRSDGDGFPPCCAACCRTGYAVSVSPPEG